jgi:hypothetical protein
MMKWIDAGDIKHWLYSDKKQCEQVLPELIQRLILATTDSIEKINFPSGDNTALGGWDGILNTTLSSPFFPIGVSGWEIGTDASPKAKAESDYTKRTLDSKGLKPSDTTFVFVTPRPFANHEEWAAAKRTEEKWKDVRVINAVILEQWLDATPAVALWLAKLIKNLPENIRCIEHFWEEWSSATDPHMTCALVIAGRITEREKITEWLTGTADILEIKGDSPDEPFAFLYASILSLPEAERARTLSRCIVVDDMQQFRSCIENFKTPLTIVAPSDCRDVAPLAVQKGHHVFLSANAASLDLHQKTLKLPRPKRSAIESNLQELGLSQTKARQLSRDHGRSIPVLRRHLMQTSAKKPEWAKTESANTLIPMLFVGAWDETKAGDREIIEQLSAKNTEEYKKALVPFLSLDDSPLQKIGDVWSLKSPLDAWFLLANSVTNDSLELFRRAILAILTKADPKYELPVDQQWAAAIYDKSNPFSEWLQTGLVESLILLAVYGDRSPHISSTQSFVDRLIQEVLQQANTWEIWATLSSILPQLGEASPDALMAAVEQKLQEDQALFQELLNDNGSMFGECRHSGLLWALEGVAWSSEYIGRATLILLKLSEIDLGGTYVNRPINTLRDILLPQLPQTYATPSERLEILRILAAKNPRLSWELVNGFFGGHISESHRFRWRYTGGERSGLEPEIPKLQQEYLRGLTPLIADLACKKENIISTLKEITRVPPEIRKQLLSTLEKIECKDLSDTENRLIYKHTRRALYWINSYGKDQFGNHLPSLKRIYQKYTPSDALDRLGWLLASQMPDLPTGHPDDFEERRAVTEKAQLKAAREVLKKSTVKEILSFADTLELPGILGEALGKAIPSNKKDNELLDALLEHKENNNILVSAYASARTRKSGEKWVHKQFKRLQDMQKYSAERCALLFLGLPRNAGTWAAVSKYGNDVESAYWKQVGPFFSAKDDHEATTAVKKLLSVDRPCAALQIAGDPKRSISSDLLTELIQKLLNRPEIEEWYRGSMSCFYLGHVLKQFHQRNELPLEDIAKIEWQLAPLLKELRRYATSPLAIHRILQQDPSFFAELVSHLYKRDDGKPDSKKQKDGGKMTEYLANHAKDVLEGWFLIPGLDKNGQLSEMDLHSWIKTAREKCSQTNHKTGGDIEIANLLAKTPHGKDEMWPCDALGNIIESLSSQLIDDHVAVAIRNARGVVSRSINEGGEQERKLEKKYRSKSNQVRVKWPRVAALLRSMADCYQGEALHQDVRDELHDLRCG